MLLTCVSRKSRRRNIGQMRTFFHEKVVNGLSVRNSKFPDKKVRKYISLFSELWVCQKNPRFSLINILQKSRLLFSSCKLTADSNLTFQKIKESDFSQTTSVSRIGSKKGSLMAGDASAKKGGKRVVLLNEEDTLDFSPPEKRKEEREEKKVVTSKQTVGW